MSEKIKFTDNDTKEEIEFSVIEETRVNNTNYLLVTEEMENDEEEEVAYILKDLSTAEDKEANYVIVEDDDEIEYVSKIFSELLEDIDIEK
ncbi:MAG: DUF1292 domain-containing protein [Lachnospiraceae bacterium]|nr:DUF1292 domain-containing protein [Lachnospiraceae bacterium]